MFDVNGFIGFVGSSSRRVPGSQDSHMKSEVKKNFSITVKSYF